MRWQNVCIESVGHVLPDTILTSAEIEEILAPSMGRLQIPLGRLQGLTGIEERRLFDDDVQPSQASTQAARIALDKAGIKGDELDLLINASIMRDYEEPSTAAFVGGNLATGHHCNTFDVSHACLGFVEALVQAANAIELGQARYALVTSAENFGPGIRNTIDILGKPDCTLRSFFDNFATLTLGCGAVAFVLTHRSLSRSDHRIVAATARSATEHNLLCVASKVQMRADAQGLRIHGLDLVVETWPHFLEASGWQKEEIDHYICHQVGVRHITEALTRMKVPVDRGYLTVTYLGNCGSAALPVTMAEALEQGAVRPGQKICFNGVGSGLACIMMAVEW